MLGKIFRFACFFKKSSPFKKFTSLICFFYIFKLEEASISPIGNPAEQDLPYSVTDYSRVFKKKFSFFLIL